MTALQLPKSGLLENFKFVENKLRTAALMGEKTEKTI
jgi:hypothetical protein